MRNSIVAKRFSGAKPEGRSPDQASPKAHQRPRTKPNCIQNIINNTTQLYRSSTTTTTANKARTIIDTSAFLEFKSTSIHLGTGPASSRQSQAKPAMALPQLQRLASPLAVQATDQTKSRQSWASLFTQKSKLPPNLSIVEKPEPKLASTASDDSTLKENKQSEFKWCMECMDKRGYMYFFGEKETEAQRELFFGMVEDFGIRCGSPSAQILFQRGYDRYVFLAEDGVYATSDLDIERIALVSRDPWRAQEILVEQGVMGAEGPWRAEGMRYDVNAENQESDWYKHEPGWQSPASHYSGSDDSDAWK
ncbi:hypothetical protein BJ508DRAFT_309887 [Ascobolus immersus RN42]|uniref:Uncharacterized protein n=1 Tax=Ascobolus immersus RN42 TaxID=1160509 RepID=A0A3N4HVF1_ASCIM|nr:hypothetical protein BJ508DRAFT_309887 [Ascobolus immersus RN42]